jgi:hypothetical protein
MNPKFSMRPRIMQKRKESGSLMWAVGPFSERTMTTSSLYSRASDRYLDLYSSRSHKFSQIANVESH